MTNLHAWVDKLWGQEEIIVNDPAHGYCGKILHIRPHWWCSLHYHPHKHETFMANTGVTFVEYYPQSTVVDGKVVELGPRHTTTLAHNLSLQLPPFTPHRFHTRTGSTIVEFSSTHSDDDVVRIIDTCPCP